MPMDGIGIRLYRRLEKGACRRTADTFCDARERCDMYLDKCIYF